MAGIQPSSPTTNSNQSVTSHWSERIYEYILATVFALVLFIVFSIYLYFRRGYYDLYIMNKIFAGVGTVQLGAVLLLGPLSRMFQIYDRYLKLRNEMGIVAFFLILLHSISSLFFLGDHFPFMKFFIPLNIPFIFGLTGLLILTFLFFISNQRSRDKLTYKKWWKLQYWGIRIAFIATALHVGIMKFPGWVDWYVKGGSASLKKPDWPGLGILVGWFMLFVLIVRVAERINTYFGRLIIYLYFALLILVYILTFLWGTQFKP